jgi:hypothetical protein
MCIVGRFCRTNNDLKNQTEKARQSKEKGAKRIERKVREEATERERERERESQLLIILFHQRLPPLEYKRHLNRLTTKS